MKTNSFLVGAFLASAAQIASAARKHPIDTNGCHADHCLRALQATQVPGRLESAKAFCAIYTAGTGTVAPTAVPSYVSKGCKDASHSVAPQRISSACSCIAPATTTSAVQTVTPTGSATAHPCAEISASSAEQVKENIGELSNLHMDSASPLLVG